MGNKKFWTDDKLKELNIMIQSSDWSWSKIAGHFDGTIEGVKSIASKNKFKRPKHLYEYSDRKLDEKKAREIREDLENGIKNKEIMKKYNISSGTVSNIKYRKIWKGI